MAGRNRGGRAVTPQNRGRFPGFDVLDSVEVWDRVTAGVVLGRLASPGALAFFTPDEVAIAGPLLDLLLAQDADPRVPVLALIDVRLATGETDGWHYDDLPQDARAWRDTLRLLAEDGFAGLNCDEQAAMIQTVQDLGTRGQRWHDLSAKHVWSLWTRYACAAFYSHPWAWNEIGYPGPAYPRGYLNTGVGKREHWEVADADAETGGVDPVPFADRVERARHERTQ